MDKKLSPMAAEMLILLADCCEGDSSTGGSYWVPPSGYKQSWSNTLGRSVFVHGSGVAGALKALYRRGLAVEKPVARYASQITEEGRLLVEHWRETNTWPVKVAV